MQATETPPRATRNYTVELITTGSELLLGRVLNTNQQWLCRQLADAGHPVSRQVAVPDTASQIQEALREALTRADLVITTGGLGPTSDDCTRDCVASLLGKKLVEDSVVLDRIREFFAKRNRPLPARTSIQAQVPEGALVLQNDFGTAPGLVISTKTASGPKESWIVMLPGPPRELRPMFSQQVLPLLPRMLPGAENFACLTLRSTGVGESVVEDMLSPALAKYVAQGVELGYCARPGQVDVRVVTRGPGAKELLAETSGVIRGILKHSLYAEEDESLDSTVVMLLRAKSQSLSVAESCTGGCLANRITNVPGASAVFRAGIITYSNESKEMLLGVAPDLLGNHGAVSEEVAKAMADGIRLRNHTTYGLSVTGIAGPTGGSVEKPIGTVFIGLSTEAGTFAVRRHNPHDRETFKEVTSQQALDLLRRKILDPGLCPR